jgi:hypothetical protein
LTEANPDSRFYPKGVTRSKKKIRRHKDPTNFGDRIRALWADPVYAAKKREQLKTMPRPGRPPGQPDGMRLTRFRKVKAKAAIKTQKVLAYMAKDTEFDPDNKIAHEAIKTCVEILNLPGAATVRMQAAKVLLEYTQRKPQTANEVTLKTAETWLDEIVADEEAK